MKARLLSPLGVALAFAPAAVAQPTGFPTYAGMIAQMQTAQANFPAICQAVNITQKYNLDQTWRGQDMWGIKISDNVAQEEDEPAFLLVANHHGNEYGTPIIALDALTRLSQGYATDPQIRSFVDNNEIWIMPTCNPDGYWTSRHNRRPGGSVDLNRNYPFLWASPCNNGVRGPGPGSEPETKTVMALSEDQRFAKVIDFHTSGRETLYGYYQSCPNHQLLAWLRAEAIAISTASGYNGRVRGPSSDGEHYQHQLGVYSNYAFLTETNTTHSPSITSANAEALRVWPGTVYMLGRPIPVWGHIKDALTGEPLEANISYLENPFTKGEQNRSEPLYGRYHAFLPNGNHTLRFQKSCYITQDVPVTVTSEGVQVEIELVRDPNAVTPQVTTFNGSGVNPVCLSALNMPVAGGSWNLQADVSSFSSADFVMFVGAANAVTGPILPAGQFLLSTPPTFRTFGVVQGGVANTSIALATSLLGTTGAVQALAFQGDRLDLIVGLCNALTYTVGCN